MTRLIKTSIVLLIAHCMQGAAMAQSFHFSQFHAAPLALNPALTGDFEGPFRLAGNFRSQWANGGKPYATGALGAEYKLLQGQLPQNDKWGIGVHLLNDQSNGGGFQYNVVSLSSAYHITLDQFGYQTLGLGFQGTYHERSINLSKLNFEEQFTGTGFDNALPTAESFNQLKKQFVDINAGLIYNYKNPETGLQLFAGAAAHNMLGPNVASTDLGVYDLPTRWTAHAGGSLPLGLESNLNFSATYLQIANASNCTLGAAINYNLDAESSTNLLFGGWYRLGDAVIPYVGLASRGMQLGFTYDVTTSNLSPIDRPHNAFELGLVFTPLGDKKGMPNWY